MVLIILGAAVHCCMTCQICNCTLSLQHWFLISTPPSFTMSHIVDIPSELKTSLRKFRFARRNQGHAALVVRIDKNKLIMQEEEQYDMISIEELADELPENSPRYVVLSYELKHNDGRTSFPLVLVNWVPRTCEIKMMTLHASALIEFQNTADVSKVIEVRDGADGLTKKAIDAKLLS